MKPTSVCIPYIFLLKCFMAIAFYTFIVSFCYDPRWKSISLLLCSVRAWFRLMQMNPMQSYQSVSALQNYVTQTKTFNPVHSIILRLETSETESTNKEKLIDFFYLQLQVRNTMRRTDLIQFTYSYMIVKTCMQM